MDGLAGKRCLECGQELEDGWRYCPYCGMKRGFYRLRPPLSFVVTSDVLDLIEKTISGLCGDKNGKKRRNTRLAGFGVFIRTQPEDSMPDPDRMSVEEKEKGLFGEDTHRREEKRARPPPRFVREPETEVEMRGDKMVLKMLVPGTKSVDDVETRRGSESIEVKVYAGDMAYFKVVKTPGRVRKVSKRIEGNNLILELQV